MDGAYERKQIVGIDLHRRRLSVLVRMTEGGEKLETIRISNDPEYLRAVMARAGEAPEVVLEACYGWCWAADTLTELGASVHLAHPLVSRRCSQASRIACASSTDSTRGSLRGAVSPIARRGRGCPLLM